MKKIIIFIIEQVNFSLTFLLKCSYLVIEDFVSASCELISCYNYSRTIEKITCSIYLFIRVYKNLERRIEVFNLLSNIKV